MNRRKVLVGGISSFVGVLAGCSSILSQNQPGESKSTLEVFVANAFDESIRVTVTALQRSTEIFNHTYLLGPAKGDESESLVGTPTDVHISIENGRSVTREYSVPPSCESPELNITLKPDEILVTNGCTTS